MKNSSKLEWRGFFVGKVRDFCKKYLSSGYAVGDDWYVGDIYNSKGDSTQICLKGAKEGFWIDNANPDEHGNFIDLLAKIDGTVITDENAGNEIIRLCNKYLDSALPQEVKIPKEHIDSEEIIMSSYPVSFGINPTTQITVKTKRKSLKTIERLISGAIHIKGTPAEQYFKKRFLDTKDLTDNKDIFYAQDLTVPPSYTLGKDMIKSAAVIFMIRNYQNEVTALQRVFIQTNGEKIQENYPINGQSIKLTVKASLGALSGSFFKLGEDSDAIGVCEGIETGMAIRKLTDYKFPIYATLGTAGMSKFKPPKHVKSITIYADADAPGKEAAFKLKETLSYENSGIKVLISTPQEHISKEVGYYNEIKDYNDLLKHGVTTIVSQMSSLDTILQKCRIEIDDYIVKNASNVRMNLDHYRTVLDIICNYFHDGYKSELQIPFEAIIRYLKERNQSSALFTDDVSITKDNVKSHMQNYIRGKINLAIPSADNSRHLSIMQDSKQTIEDDAILMAKEILRTYLLNGDGIIYARSMFYVYGNLSLDLDTVPRTHWIPYKLEQIEAFCAEFLEKHHINKRTNTMMQAMAFYISRKSHKFGLESDPFLQVKAIINCKNGELHIQEDGTAKLKPHNHFSYLTYCLDTMYDAEAKCPTFDKIIESVFITAKEKDNVSDKEEEKNAKKLERQRLLRIVQMMFGYFIQPNRWLTKFFFWEGRSASNGKSSLVKILNALIGGQNTLSMNIHDLATQFGLFPTIGKLVIIDDDASTAKPLSESMLKKLSQNSINLVNQKSRDQYTAMNIAVPLIVTNNTIKIDEVGAGLSRRIIIIPFENKFETVSDKDNPVTTVIQQEMSGVLNWAIKGFQMLLENHNIFNPTLQDDKKSLDIMPRKVRMRIKQYLDQANDFRIFWNRNHYLSENARKVMPIAYITAHFKKYLYSQNFLNGGRFSEEDIANELQEYFGIKVMEGVVKNEATGSLKNEKYIEGYELVKSLSQVSPVFTSTNPMSQTANSTSKVASPPLRATKQQY